METSKISPEIYSALHLNISNLNKSFESFAEFYKLLSFKFSIICFPETSSKKATVCYMETENITKRNNLCINCEATSKKATVCYMETENITKRNNLCINCEATEILSIEIRNNNVKNIICNIVYRPPDGDLEVCKNYFQSAL